MKTFTIKANELKAIAIAWLNDFAPVNDSYNMAKFKLCAKDANKIIAAAKRAMGMKYYHATLNQVNSELEGL